MRRKRSLVARRPGSPNWYENFTVNGHRFRASLETHDREQAEIIAAKKRSDALLGKLIGKKPELTLSQALGRYLVEHGQHLASAGDIARMSAVLIAELGKHKLLSEITASDLSTYAARRRLRLSNRSVNAELEHLRAVVRRASVLWGIETPAINWQDLLLEEAGEREHVLSAEEEVRLFAALRPDYHAMVRFALITGLRLGNVIDLTWAQVDWDARTISFRVKSRKPGGELHYVPITPAVAAILSLERGRDRERVFTYVCDRNRHDPRRGFVQRKGIRYPFTHDGWRKAWKAALEAAGIADFRFHDLRHTAGTRALHAHRNLKTVQRMLGHKNIATTLRYTRSDVEDVRAAMEAVETQSSLSANRREGKTKA
jgi:integrase